MNRQSLCDLLDQPPEAPPQLLLGQFHERLKVTRELLAQEGLAKPVRNRATSLLAVLESQELQPVIAELEAIARADALCDEIEAEFRKAAPPDVIGLLCRKLEGLLPSIPTETERFSFEKRIADFSARNRPPAPVAVAAPERAALAGGGSFPPVDLAARVESYFAQIKLEQSKTTPAHGRIKLWLEKIEPLIDQVPQIDQRLALEERVVEVQYWLKGESRAPWATGGAPRPVLPTAAPSAPLAPAVAVAERTTVASRDVIKPTAATVLELTPRPAEGTMRKVGAPLRFVARSRFIIGRQRSKADFVAWFLPESPENQQRTDSISRVNTTLFLKGTQIWVQDGEQMEDGKSKPSAGTVVDGQALGAGPVQLNFAKERRIRVGQAAYELSALHLPATEPLGPSLPAADPGDTTSSQATVLLPSRSTGCVRFRALSCREVPTLATWVFSEASIGADANNAVTLEGMALPPVALRVFFAQEGFWISVPTGSPCKVTLDNRAVLGGQFVPLQQPGVLAIGQLLFDVKMSS